MDLDFVGLKLEPIITYFVNDFLHIHWRFDSSQISPEKVIEINKVYNDNILKIISVLKEEID
jgi:hypothetical protein